mgnify:CR=1 FL=1
MSKLKPIINSHGLTISIALLCLHTMPSNEYLSQSSLQLYWAYLMAKFNSFKDDPNKQAHLPLVYSIQAWNNYLSYNMWRRLISYINWSKSDILVSSYNLLKRNSVLLFMPIFTNDHNSEITNHVQTS